MPGIVMYIVMYIELHDTKLCATTFWHQNNHYFVSLLVKSLETFLPSDLHIIHL